MVNIKLIYEYLCTEVIWTTQKLWQDRRGWVILAMVTMLLVLIVGYWNANTQHGENGYVFSSVLLNLSVSVLAAALIELFSQIRRLLEVRKVQRWFREFWGVGETENSTAIVLPKFEASVTNVWERTWEKTSQLLENKEPVIPIKGNYPLIDVGVKSDIVAASGVIAAFNEAAFQSPTIIWDDQAVKEIDSPLSQFKTFISIGLFSNDLVIELNRRYYIDRMFKLHTFWNDTDEKTVANLNCRIKIINYREKRLNTNEDDWENHDLDSKTDYGLISKIVLPDGKTIFLFGGIDFEATEITGKFLHKNWSEMRRWTDDITKQSIQNLPFTLVIDVPLGKDGDVGNHRKVRVLPLAEGY